MMKKEFENGRAVLAALFAVCVASAAVPQGLQAQVLTACYVPDVGVVYRIQAAGLPDECTETTHVEFSWNMEGPAGPEGPTGPQGPQGEASLANLERVSAQFTLADLDNDPTSIPTPDGRHLATRTTNCPPGKIVITGSSTYDASADSPFDYVSLGGQPTANGLGWEALFRTDTNSYTVTVWAICF